MDNRVLINQPLSPVQKEAQIQKNRQQDKINNNKFRELLAEKLKGKSNVKFSRHARKRLISRQIQLNEDDLEQLNNAVQKAESKGSRDSLIMINNIAYVVSVENKTVVTAVDEKNVKENVFTNIDSAVFM